MLFRSNIGFSDAFADFGAHGQANALDVLLIQAFEALWIIAASEGLGSVVAIFLKGLDFTREAALELDEIGVFLRVVNELAHEVGAEEDGGEGSGGGLKADLRQFGGIVATEELGEIVLESALFESALLGDGPFVVTAASFPVGDIALGEAKAAFVESHNDSAMGQIVGEHAVDQVTFELREVGDLAVAGLAVRTILERLQGGGRDPELKAFG